MKFRHLVLAHALAALVVAADRIVPPSEIERLWQHWGQPASLWDGGTHCLWRDPQLIRDRIANHLKDHLLRHALRAEGR